ncbi:MAG TPA: 3'(2'),5'-bisphosphate nucleotidase CysQ [Methylocystis sp.]|nr:3'(2'),5'-bisphosphate nucleotidase CysQ [Methylocystis sp.]
MQDSPTESVDLSPRLEALVRKAGDIAMAYFRPGERTSAHVTYKSGGSPVTEADFAVDRFLREGIAALAPQIGWLSEETADSAERLSLPEIAIVDPIDGTTAFVRGDARWAVSLALVEKGRPVAGVVHAPALERTFTASAGRGAYLNGEPIRVSARTALEGARVVAPGSLATTLEKSRYGFAIAPRSPSLALRLVEVARGADDLVFAGPNSRDWDIAAADVILREAGGALFEMSGGPLVYNRASSRREGLVAAPVALIDDSLDLAHAALKGKL